MYLVNKRFYLFVEAKNRKGMTLLTFEKGTRFSEKEVRRYNAYKYVEKCN